MEDHVLHLLNSVITIQVLIPTLTPTLSLKGEGSDSLPLRGGGLGWGLVYPHSYIPSIKCHAL